MAFIWEKIKWEKPEVKSLKDVYLQWRKVKMAGQKMAEDPLNMSNVEHLFMEAVQLIAIFIGFISWIIWLCRTYGCCRCCGKNLPREKRNKNVINNDQMDENSVKTEAVNRKVDLD